jgi:hypothetical protein
MVTLAQTGDELARQQGVPTDSRVKQQTGDAFGAIESQLQQQLSLAEDFQRRGQERFGEVSRFAAGQGVAGVEAVRDLGQRVSGEAPSALIGASTALGRALQTGVAEAQEAASSDNVINILSQMISLKEKQDESIRQSIEDGFKIGPDGVIEALTEPESAQRTLVGEEAVAEVIKQGGGDLIRKGGSKDERFAIAESILRSGGIQQYKNQIPLIELITSSEENDIKTQTDLLQLIDQGVALFSGAKTKTGTGPLAALIPGFAAGEETRSLRRSAENIKAQYAKIISGATVSDKEMKRLEKFLPTSKKTEQENLEDLKQLSKDLQINQLIFEKGKREGLTANQAYGKYGQEIFDQFGNGVEEVETGKIKVKRKSDGQIGFLDSEDEFDSEIYERTQ